MSGFEREQRALENLEAWAARGDAWVRGVAALKTRQLTERPLRRGPPPLEQRNEWRGELGLPPIARGPS